MKKFILYLNMFSLVALIGYLASCDSDGESDEDTFNLDTLTVNPSSDINDEFTVMYGVTTTGFPQFFAQVYLSDDDELDVDDLLIADVADTDTNSDPNNSYFNELNFKVEAVPGGNLTRFIYKFPSDATYTGDATTSEALSGKTKYIIGRFFHTTGLQIRVFRTRLAVEVDFQ